MPLDKRYYAEEDFACRNTEWQQLVYDGLPAEDCIEW